MTDKTFIYALCDPDTAMVRYVGKSDNPEKRLRGHFYEKSKTHKTNWINTLKKQNKKPVLKIIEEVDRSAWEASEIKWIAYYRNLSGNLTNTTDGGDYLVHTPEICRKISESKMGHIVTEETRKKISLAKKNPSIEYRKKLSEALKGRKLSSETRKKMSQAFKGRVYSKETRSKMPVAQYGKTHSYETREKLSRATKAYMSLPEIRKKQSDSCKKQWANPEYRKKRSEDVRKQWANPELRKKFLDARKVSAL